MIKAILFDIGDVLFDEDVPHTWLFHTILLTLRRHGKDVTWDAWNADRIRLAAQGPNPEAAIEEALAIHCDDPIEAQILWCKARDEYERMREVRPYGFLLDGMDSALRELKPRFRLGVVANQHWQVTEALDQYGVSSLFDVIIISETVGLYKPNPAIFQLGLDQLGLQPSEAIFVGDRPDNDIQPARAIGMKTIRFKRGNHYIHYNPDGQDMVADVTVTEIAELAPAVRTLAT